VTQYRIEGELAKILSADLMAGGPGFGFIGVGQSMVEAVAVGVGE